MGRPKLDIDENIVRRLANRQCAKVEIAAVMGCSVDTLDRRFAEQIPLWREEGKSKLRSRMFELAGRKGPGQATMLIWLSKQYLGMADKQEVKSETITLPVDVAAVYESHPELLQEAVELEKRCYAAFVDARNVGSADLSRLAVPPTPPSAGGNGNGTAGKPHSQPPGGADSG
jgi:hypothetical protein